MESISRPCRCGAGYLTPCDQSVGREGSLEIMLNCTSCGNVEVLQIGRVEHIVESLEDIHFPDEEEIAWNQHLSDIMGSLW
jgi:hypothetical protein